MSSSLDPDRLARALHPGYSVGDLLGEGGSASVFVATDLKHGRKVAVKVLRPELAAAVGAERFLREIRTTANLQHSHILPLFDSGESEGLLWYVMPFVEGASLEERIEQEGPIPLDEGLRILREVAAALDHAHARGIVHRDIKPANILLGDGGALVADFGIAKAVSEAGQEGITATGMSLGTPAYMSPEQLTGDGEVGSRSDVYALGCLVFEMLAGRPPFRGATVQSVVTRMLTESPPSLRDLRPEIPRPVSEAVAKALAKDPAERFESAAAFATACEPGPAAGTRTRTSRARRVALGASVVVVVGLVATLGWRAIERAQAKASLSDIAALVDQGRFVEAYAMLEGAERWVPGDPELQAYLDEASDLLTVETEPSGATVTLQRYDLQGDHPEPRVVGTTPLRDLRVPRADYRMQVELEGFHRAERIASSTGLRGELVPPAEARHLSLMVPMTPAEEVPEGMVPVPGGDYEVVSPDAPLGLEVELEPFFIDRFEVTNAEYTEFVDAGGYSAEEFWEDVPPEVRASLVDRTGLYGPRGWTGQRPEEDADRLPVSGVSWYEARAYCQWKAARLPTIFEWEKAARDGQYATVGVVMPWGFASSAASGRDRANFNSGGAAPVDAHPFGVSPYGAWGMAGNVREWLANPSGEGFAATGGSWSGPVYLYTEYSVTRGAQASPDLGFRCARSDGPGDQGSGPLSLEIPTPVYTPVDEETFRTLLTHYRYDRIAPNPRLVDYEEAAGWVRERYWIDGFQGDSILAYLWRPTASSPPFQPILYIGSAAFFNGVSVGEEVEWVLGPVIRGGRAVFAPALHGAVERPFPPGEGFPPPPSVAFRDLMVRHATEVRMTIDWAETRAELDLSSLAYAAFSLGAGSRLAFSVVDDRYRALVYIGGGIDERVKPTLPEADNVNFAPYVGAPVLLLNGLNDEEHPWLSRALPLWELLPEPKDSVLVEGAGHLPPPEVRIPAINGFLDRILGPVRR